jgi:hypothetical protein
MSISSVASSSVTASSVARLPEAAEAPGPDHDGDSDDAGAMTQALQAALPPGVGETVDKTA